MSKRFGRRRKKKAQAEIENLKQLTKALQDRFDNFDGLLKRMLRYMPDASSLRLEEIYGGFMHDLVEDRQITLDGLVEQSTYSQKILLMHRLAMVVEEDPEAFVTYVRLVEIPSPNDPNPVGRPAYYAISRKELEKFGVDERAFKWLIEDIAKQLLKHSGLLK